MLFFLGKSYRVVAHDRRGHGRSDQTDTGNEMDTYAADVAELVELLPNGTLKTYPGLSHGLFATHPDPINADLLAFIRT